MHLQAIIDRIHRYIKDNNSSVFEMERKADIKENVIRNLLTGKAKQPKLSTLVGLSRLMECSIGQLVGEVPDSTEVVNLKGNLYVEVVQEVLQVYRDHKVSPTFGKLAYICKDVYLFHVAQDKKSADKGLIDWHVEKYISGELKVDKSKIIEQKA